MFELGPTDGALSTLLGRQRGVRMKLYLLFSPLFFFFSDVSHVSQEFSCNLCEAAAPVRGDSHVSEMKPSSDVSNLFKSLKTDPPSSNAASPGTEDCDSFARSSAGSHFFFFFSPSRRYDRYGPGCRAHHDATVRAQLGVCVSAEGREGIR